ncbi:MAG: hypothetical protein KGK07_12960 [Chloroflexota bacterium]|nr:hypothetical protein [Chloroflexota bacterium]
MPQASRPSGGASAHWKRLGLVEGAPECAIDAAWKWQMARHHPDVGGDAEVARALNVARDALKGSGAQANEYVARHYESQPWLVLGVARDADIDLAQRVGAQLAAALAPQRRLADRVAWAVVNFGAQVTPPHGAAPQVRVTPPQPTRRPEARPRAPATPGRPDGLPSRVDFGTLAWGDETARTLKLTWARFAPYEISVDAPAPLRAEVTASKALPGRFAVALSVDWEHEAFSHDPALRGHTLDGSVVVRWAGGGEAAVPVRGVALYPAVVRASPPSLDLGAVDADARAHASLVLVSSAATTVEIEPPAWLRRVGGDGHARTGPLRLAADVPVRVELAVRWEPIFERAAAAFAGGRPVRPTGRVVVRWGERALEVPAQVVVRPPEQGR